MDITIEDHLSEEESEEKIKQFHELGLDDRILKVSMRLSLSKCKH